MDAATIQSLVRMLTSVLAGLLLHYGVTTDPTSATSLATDAAGLAVGVGTALWAKQKNAQQALEKNVALALPAGSTHADLTVAVAAVNAGAAPTPPTVDPPLSPEEQRQRLKGV